MSILFLTQAAVKKGQVDKATYLRCMSNYLIELNKLDVPIIVKPHPMDSTNYKKMSQDLINVSVKKGKVEHFLRDADVVINFRSSTILDAMIAKKPVIVIGLLDEVVSKRYDLSRENRVLTIVNKSEELVDTIRRVIDDKIKIIRRQNQYLQSYFYKLDGKSHERIAQYIYDTLTIQK